MWGSEDDSLGVRKKNQTAGPELGSGEEGAVPR